MTTTAIPTALALLAGSTGATNGGNQTQGLNPIAKAILAAMSTLPNASPTPGMNLFNPTSQPQSQAASTQSTTSNLCEVR